ncbi:bifunctional DNA primase/polymerase [Mesorhizobium sp. M2C.T.Ca.TU.009.01.2.1]|nr:bifunctional DNA primase/polymerase [Mesorhizobium sp. M2C.T.Ca.TU.002.02.1.1]RUU68189.1 bifunctional DNA primase/polymerase [Mesorhizobium sp. M2C.T.Ca.TU.009.01.2.1]
MNCLTTALLANEDRPWVRYGLSWRMQPEVLTDYALRLRERGYICLPLRAGGKHLDLAAMEYDPLHLQTLRKDLKELAFNSITFQLAQKPPDGSDIASWFRGFAGNVGILGGFSNLMILDFDDDAGYRAWRADHKAIANGTPIAKSPSGFHVYLRTREPMVSSSLHFGLRRVGHVKALGGYVVGSPSVLRDGSSYRWLENQSPFDIEPQLVDSLGSLSLRPVSLLKHHYDRLLKRGFFERQ